MRTVDGVHEFFFFSFYISRLAAGSIAIKRTPINGSAVS